MRDTIETHRLIKILKANGCYKIEKKPGHCSDHDDWYSPITNRQFQVPRHRVTAKGTARAILKQAGIKAKI